MALACRWRSRPQHQQQTHALQKKIPPVRSPTQRIAMSSEKSSSRPYSSAAMSRRARNSRLKESDILRVTWQPISRACISQREAYQTDALGKSNIACDAYFGIH